MNQSMSNPSEHNDGVQQPQRQPAPTACREAEEVAPAPSDAEGLRELHHELANALHGILLQVRCADALVENGEAEAIKEHLSQIELAVGQSRELLKELVDKVQAR